MSVADSEEVTKTEGMERVMRASKLRNKGWFRDIESVMITRVIRMKDVPVVAVGFCLYMIHL